MRTIALLFPLLVSGMNTSHAQVNLLVNPSFELPALTAASTCDNGTPWCLKGTNNVTGWTSTLDGVTVIHNNYLGGVNPPILVTASNGLQYVDMNQTGGNNGGIFQTVAATPGQVFSLSFDYSAWATNAVGASALYRLYDPSNGTVLSEGVFAAPVGGIWTTQTRVVTATGTSLGVLFQSQFAPQAAIAIDNVVLTAVPEPKAYALLLAGLVATVLAVRRQRV